MGFARRPKSRSTLWIPALGALCLVLLPTGARAQEGEKVVVGLEEGVFSDELTEALEDEGFRARVGTCGSPYGDGHAADRIGATLCEVPLDRDLLLKTLPY